MHYPRVASLVAAALLLGSCGDFPRDAAGALKRIQSSGEVRVGVAEHEPWVKWDGERATGLEPELIERWAQTLGARVTWQRGPVAEHIKGLHSRKLDVLIAGLEEKTPHAPEVALTQPYLEAPDSEGKKTAYAMAVTQGENALLLSLDRFLLQQDEAALRRRLEELRQSAPR